MFAILTNYKFTTKVFAACLKISFVLKKLLGVLIVLILSSFFGHAQKKVIDSLQKKLSQSNGVERVEILIQLSDKLLHLDQNKALQYVLEADSLSKLQDYDIGRCQALNIIGIISKESGNYKQALYNFNIGIDLASKTKNKELLHRILYEKAIVNYKMGDYQPALANFTKALKFYQSVDDQAWVANIKNEIGNVNLFQSDYSKALKLYLDALRIREDLNDLEKIAQTLNNIGLVYMYQENLDEALNYLKRSLELKQKFGDKKTIARSHNNVGLIYELKGEQDKALESYFFALKLLNPETDKATITTIENNIGLIYNGMGEYEKALLYLKRSLKAKEKMGEKMDIAQSLTSIGKTYRQKADLQQAVAYGSKGLKMAYEINSKKEIQEAAENLYITYEQFGDYKNALKYHIISENYRDSLKNEAQSKEIGRLEAKYAFDKQKAEEEKLRLENEKIEELKQARQRIIILFGFVLLCILFVAAIFYVKSLGKKNEVITQQNQELEAILNTLQIAHTKLTQSEKMASLGVLTAGVAHEINNPVNFVFNGIENIKVNYNDFIQVINKYEEILKKSASEVDLKEIEKIKKEFYYDEIIEEIPQTIDIVKDGATRISEIVKGLRNFSRLDESTKKEVDIHEGINSSIVLLKNKMKYKIELVKKYDTNSQPVCCYPGQINQVFLNLLDNSIGAIEKKGTITISTAFKDSKVFIKIKDTGRGIPEKIKNKVFDPFFTTKDVGKGMGLGLSISHGIIENHGGKLNFESEEGKGTVFVIELPIA
jgi:two-component system, NtrC family, sensor kinase